MKTVILASRKVYYNRSNPNSKPVIIVDNPDQIGKKKKQLENLEVEVSLKRVNSLPQELVSLQDIDFDLKFEHSLFRIKSESDLKITVLDLVFTSFLNTKQNQICTLITSLIFKTKTKLNLKERALFEP